MANEGRITLDMVLNDGASINHTWSPGGISGNITNPLYEQKIISVGTTDETVSFDTITTLSYVGLYNLDDTNYVQYGDNATTYLGRLQPTGFPCGIPMDPGANLHLKANTAACNVLIVAYGS